MKVIHKNFIQGGAIMAHGKKYKIGLDKYELCPEGTWEGYLDSYQPGETEYGPKLNLYYKMPFSIDGKESEFEVSETMWGKPNHEAVRMTPGNKLGHRYHMFTGMDLYDADPDAEYTVEDIIGSPCIITVAHKNGTGKNADQIYSRVEFVTLLPGNRKEIHVNEIETDVDKSN